MAALYGWCINFILLIIVLGLNSFQIMLLADLASDHMNPYDTSYWVNICVLPEYTTQALLCVSFLFTGHWFFFLLSLPYLCYNATLYIKRRHLVDVTEIYNQLSWEKRIRLYKLIYLVILLVLSIFWLLWTIGEEWD